MNSIVTLLNDSPVVFLVLICLLGLIIGSFLNVVIHRLPRILEQQWQQQCHQLLGIAQKENEPEPAPGLVSPCSQCPHCGHRISALENIPVLSYLILGGKCSSCKQGISIRYPIVELISALLAVAVAWKWGVSTTTAAVLVLTWSLIALSFIDYDHQILPDIIVLPLLWLGLLFNSQNMFASIESALYGAMAGYLSLWLVYHGFKLLTGKEGMGYGDFKLFAVFGAWLGWQLLPVIILLAAVAGSVIGLGAILILGRDRNLPMPFGPYLAITGWIAVLWGDNLLGAYLRYAGLT
ncbi:MAG TPA: prepilin peptidase [Acidiferrobacteraceae bacterium]|nr:prepilin peptidase [Acidiferrobacteraceae bacterium]